MWFEYNNSVVVSMPGVPAEMKLAMTGEIIPRLKEKYKPGAIIHKTVLIYNIPEAVLAEKLNGWEDQLPDEIKLAYLPAPGRIRLRLTARGNDPDVLAKGIQKAVDALYPIVGENIYGEEDQPASEIFANYFRSTGKTISLAESCSGGYLAHLVTMVPGSSNYFRGSMVTYSNDLKINILGVKPQDIENYGAVSRQIVEQMAIGAVRIAESDYAIATSGIAGPGGGSEEKPVGTVWIAWAGPGNRVVSKEFRFGKDRERNIVRTSETALIELMQLMKRGLL
jgi:nicotinamide-nucleotide amidase